jgi:hypothetical protein
MHSDFKTNILPEEHVIWNVIRTFNRKVRVSAIHRIEYLHGQSDIIDHNMMEVDCDAMLKNWNNYNGPKFEAREIQDKLRISDREVREFIDPTVVVTLEELARMREKFKNKPMIKDKRHKKNAKAKKRSG